MTAYSWAVHVGVMFNLGLTTLIGFSETKMKPANGFPLLWIDSTTNITFKAINLQKAC